MTFCFSSLVHQLQYVFRHLSFIFPCSPCQMCLVVCSHFFSPRLDHRDYTVVIWVNISLMVYFGAFDSVTVSLCYHYVIYSISNCFFLGVLWRSRCVNRWGSGWLLLDLRSGTTDPIDRPSHFYFRVHSFRHVILLHLVEKAVKSLSITNLYDPTISMGIY